MVSTDSDILPWIKNLKGWQCELAYRILSNGHVSKEDYAEILQMLKDNRPFEEKPFPVIEKASNSDCADRLRVVSIESIKGIEMLSPKKPIVFGDKNLVVVYGDNGSGKSGVIRILKKMCGKSGAKMLKGNIFEDNFGVGECKLKYQKGNSLHEVDWRVTDKPIEDLISVDIYDTDTGVSYIKEAKSVTYTPMVVSFFESLSDSYQRIGQMLTEERGAKGFSVLPKMPDKYSKTKLYEWYNKLTCRTDLGSEEAIIWNDEKENRLQGIEERLRLKDAIVAAKEKQSNKTQAQNILSNLEDAIRKISPEYYQDLKDKRQKMERSRNIVQEATAVLKQEIELVGVGTLTWKALWETARQYSTAVAYPSFEFPFIGDDAKCVLCQQPLGEKAKHRFQSFNSFIQGAVELEAQRAEKEYNETVNKLPKPIDEEFLHTQCLAAGLDEDGYQRLKEAWGYISVSVSTIVKFPETIEDVGQYIQNPIRELKEHIANLESSIQQYLEDAKEFNREEVERLQIELLANKWCSEQQQYIKDEISRLKTINQLDEWLKETNTQGISRKASQISENVITDDYIKRFNKELKRLGATRIKAELVKRNISRGVPYHSIRIRDAKQSTSPAEIFSEGEFRIISLAAFLADVTGGGMANPFIFDDPISSLDQNFEEATIDRLIELSKERQVIVFTHRLSLLGLLHDGYKRDNADTIGMLALRREVWGTGEPSEIPFYGKPQAKFNKMKNERLHEAKRILETEGYEAYYPLAKALCSDFRNMIEHTIESVLLAEVVVRYRRSVTTDGRIKGLSKISIDDCVLLDDFMTKYSRYEHSQSYDTKVDMPEPSDIEMDIQRILDWLQDFSQRKIPELP